MPRAEERTRPPQDALEYGDIPGVPTANWGTGETCLESELKKSRVPLGCVGFLLFVVLVSGSGGGGGGGDGAASSASVQPHPPPPPPPVVFGSCKGRTMDCNGAESCGVVVLETGMGQTFYKHDSPSVHGLWPQDGAYGNSACIAPQSSSTVDAYLPPCYNNEEAQQDPAHQREFVQHEWEKHGRCSGAANEQQYFGQICALADQGTKLMDNKKPLQAIANDLKHAGLPVYCVVRTLVTHAYDARSLSLSVRLSAL
jgi:hypothetical protein